MFKYIASILILASLALPALAKDKNLMQVTGESVLEDHSINQYDDVENPPQGYELTIPAGYFLNHWATPKSDAGVCVLTQKSRTVLIEAHDLETDAGGCYAFLIFIQLKTGRQKTVSYHINQEGT